MTIPQLGFVQTFCEICPWSLTKLFSSHVGVTCTAIVDRGRNVVTCSRDGTARLWNCGNSKCLGILYKGADIINSCAISQVCNSVDLGSPEQPPRKMKLCFLQYYHSLLFNMYWFCRNWLAIGARNNRSKTLFFNSCHNSSHLGPIS